MTVHNFQIEAHVDGRNTPLTGGPNSKDGGFDLVVYIRDEGRVLRALSVTGTADSDGNLTIRAQTSSEVDLNCRKDIGSVEVTGGGLADFEITTKR